MGAEFLPTHSEKSATAIFVYEIDYNVQSKQVRLLPSPLTKTKEMTGIELMTMSAVVVCIVVAFCGYRDSKK